MRRRFVDVAEVGSRSRRLRRGRKIGARSDGAEEEVISRAAGQPPRIGRSQTKPPREAFCSGAPRSPAKPQGGIKEYVGERLDACLFGPFLGGMGAGDIGAEQHARNA